MKNPYIFCCTLFALVACAIPEHANGPTRQVFDNTNVISESSAPGTDITTNEEPNAPLPIILPSRPTSDIPTPEVPTPPEVPEEEKKPEEVTRLFRAQFEQTLGGEGDSDITAGDVTLELSNTQASQGNQSLRVRSGPGPALRLAYVDHNFPQRLDGTHSEIFARFFLYVPSGFSVRNWAILLSFDDQESEGGETDKISIDLTSDDALSIANNTDNTFGRSGPGAIQRNTWQCIEMRVDMKDSQGSTAVWVNDNFLFGTQAVQDTIPSNGIREVHYGAVHIAGTETDTIQYYMDDLAIDSKRIGCGP